MLEKTVDKHGGKVIMAKLNTDDHGDLAGNLKVRSLPTVMSIFEGKLLEQFIGAQPQRVVEAFVERAVKAGEKAGGKST
jgi:putative thioredoxin